MKSEYQPKLIEKQAQEYWQKNKVFEAKENQNYQKFYCLSMLPYPSGSLHIGHIRNYAIGDAITRYQKMLGKNVMQPMGWDAFGLPAENAAIERGLKASDWTKSNIKEMKNQLIAMGFGFDWSREIATCDASYYRHEQWFFTELVKKGLAYRKRATVNWDPVENTVLANEQVIDGKGYRSGAAIEKKQIEQWFIKSTHYIEDLLASIENKLEKWPNQVKTLQKEWIGKSTGLSFSFEVVQNLPKEIKNIQELKDIKVYTTRADTLMGVGFLAIAIEHSISQKLAEFMPDLETFIEKAKELDKQREENQEVKKIGFEIPSNILHAIHPITGKKLSIWVANYILIEYGTGAIMAVPAHDERDNEFAHQYGLDILPVIKNPNQDSSNKNDIYTGYGKLYHSNQFDGLDFNQAVDAIEKALAEKNNAKKMVNYRMHDWGVSRQRYWGCPIPILWDDDGNMALVSPENLPVELPLDVAFSGHHSPLAQMKEFTQVVQNKQNYTRETDTFDTFFESSWYFLRYCCPDAKEMVDSRIDYWMPVDQYVGGIEHATMHLMYARVFQRMMKDCGLVKDKEPFTKLLCQGMVVGPYYYREVERKGNKIEQYFAPDELNFEKDNKGVINRAISKKDGKEVLISERNIKISKSKKNGKDPLEIAKNYSVDTLRLFMLFAAPADKALVWNERGLEGAHRFLKRLYRAAHQLKEQDMINLSDKSKQIDKTKLSKAAIELYVKLQQTIHKAELSFSKDYQFNTAIAANMELLNQWMVFDLENIEDSKVKVLVIRQIVAMLYPIIPHLCHYLWLELGNDNALLTSDIKEVWPKVDGEYLYANQVDLIIQINGKTRSKMEVNRDITDEEIKALSLKNDRVRKQLENTKLRKIIVVNQTARKLVNLVMT